MVISSRRTDGSTRDHEAAYVTGERVPTRVDSVRVAMLQDVRALEAVGEHQRLVGEEIGGGTVGDDLAAVDDHRPRAELDDQLEVVGGDDLGGGDGGQQRLELTAAARVEVAGGL